MIFLKRIPGAWFFNLALAFTLMIASALAVVGAIYYDAISYRGLASAMANLLKVVILASASLTVVSLVLLAAFVLVTYVKQRSGLKKALAALLLLPLDVLMIWVLMDIWSFYF